MTGVRRLGYLPGLDGLRALAVTAVILYHAQQNMPTSWLPGGFLGVEVFFVISGYLITALLIGEHDRSGRIDLREFWKRRARRLLPALFALLVVSIGIVGVGGHYSERLREHVRSFRGMWTASWFYVTNWYQIIAGLNYAERSGRPPLLRHLWSLAVEEQFYLVWPLVMLVLLWRWRSNLRRVGGGLLLGALAIAVATGLVYRPSDIPLVNALYLATPSRMSGLLLGAALATVWRPWESSDSARPSWADRLVRHRRVLEVGAVVALGALVAVHARWHLFVNGVDGDHGYSVLFRGGFLLVDIATAIVILVVVLPGSFVGERALGARPLVWLGKRSYGLYLWHWPVFQLTRPFGDQSLLDPSDPDLRLHWLAALVVRIAITVAITEVSYRLIETPVRLGRWPRFERRARVTKASAWLGVMVVSSTFLMSVPLTFEAVDQLAVEAACNANADRCDNVGSTSVTELTDPAADPTPDTTPDTPVDTSTATSVASDTAPSATDPAASDSTVPTATEPAPSTSSAPSTTARRPGPIPLALGDSVMYSASGALRSAGVRVDAAIGRSFIDVTRLIPIYRALRQVGDVVVVGLGTAGGITQAQMDKAMKVLAPVPHVIFITPQAGGKSFELPSREIILATARNYPNVTVIDWRELAQDKLRFHQGAPGVAFSDLYFYRDRIHLVSKGRRYFADLILAEISRVQG